MAAQIDSIVLSFTRLYDSEYLAIAGCAQIYVLDGTAFVSGLVNNGPFSTSLRFAVEVEITPVVPVIYSRSGYLADYPSSALDNAGFNDLQFLGQNGTSQTAPFQIATPQPDLGNGSAAQTYYGLLGIPETLSDTAVVNRLSLGTSGQPIFWMNTPTSRTLTVECFYRIYDNVTGYGPRVSVGTFSQNLPVLDCESATSQNCIYTQDPSATCSYSQDAPTSCSYSQDPATTCTYAEG